MLLNWAPSRLVYLDQAEVVQLLQTSPAFCPVDLFITVCHPACL
jgi:hypothetical protein